MKGSTTILTIVMALLMLLPFSTSVLAEEGDILQQGRQAYYERRYEAAQELLLKIHDAEGYIWSANYYLGLTFMRQNKLSEAAYHMDKAYEERPQCYWTLTHYARILYRDGKHQEARTILAQVPEDKRETDEMYYNLHGLLAMAGNDLPQAVESFKKATEINPDNYYVLNNLGLALIRSFEFQKAQDYLLKTLAFDPPEAYIYNNIGITYENLQDYHKAKEYYEKSLEKDPNHERAAMNLQRILSKLQD